jgi:hypothetical protein
MKTWNWLVALLAVVLLSGSAAWAQGDFYVIAGGGPPVGTKITSVPYEIKNPGFYFLTGNLTYNGTGNAITVSADNVTLDLMGFSLSYTGSATNPIGIFMSGRSNVEIRNGSITGFYVGVNENSTGGAKHRIINIRANDSTIAGGSGIQLVGINHLVQGCSACNNQGVGMVIYNGTVTGCTASNNHNFGIYLTGVGSVIGNVANNNINDGFILGTGNIVVDRNSADSNGTNYSGGPANPAYWGINAGR